MFFGLVLVLTARAQDTTGQVEPNAGSWKTWAISSGKDFRVPPPPDAAASGRSRDCDPLNLGSMIGVRGAAEDELRHTQDLRVLFGDDHDPRPLVQPSDELSIGALEHTAPHRVQRAERHARTKRAQMHVCQRDADAIRLRRAHLA